MRILCVVGSRPQLDASARVDDHTRVRPGTRCCRILVATGLEVGTDFHLAFSPERVDPGRTDWTAKTTPKMVGGVTDGGRAAACTLYERAMDKVIAVSSPEAAELSKLLENIFRSVNIALVNELDDDSAERARLVVDFRNPTGENGSLNGRVWKL